MLSSTNFQSDKASIECPTEVTLSQIDSSSSMPDIASSSKDQSLANVKVTNLV